MVVVEICCFLYGGGEVLLFFDFDDDVSIVQFCFKRKIVQ